MNALFPLMLDLRGWPCAVLGGGPLAEEKVRLFDGTGARLAFIAAEAPPAVLERATAGGLEWIAREPMPEDVAHYRIVISTLGREANQAFAAAAERAGTLFNAADDPGHCRFLLPSVHRQGDLIIAVSTSGKCPAMAVRIREQCARIFDHAYADFLALAAEMRPRISSCISEFGARKRFWYRLADSGVLALLRTGRLAEARREAERLAAAAAGEVHS